MEDDDSQYKNKQLLQQEQNAANDYNQNQAKSDKDVDADSNNQIVEESNTKLDNNDRDNTSVD